MRKVSLAVVPVGTGLWPQGSRVEDVDDTRNFLQTEVVCVLSKVRDVPCESTVRP